VNASRILVKWCLNKKNRKMKRNMKSKCRVLLTIVLFMMCQMVCGQTIVDRSNMTLGKVKSAVLCW